MGLLQKSSYNKLLRPLSVFYAKNTPSGERSEVAGKKAQGKAAGCADLAVPIHHNSLALQQRAVAAQYRYEPG
jgi:hypothetical protein